MSPPKLPGLPRLPRLADIIHNNPLHEVIEDAKATIASAKTEVSSIASSLRVEGLEEPETEVQETAIIPVEPAIETHTGVSDAETLQYQHDHLTEELNLLETHLSEGCKIASKFCDCCTKAVKRIEAYSKESVPIAARQGKDTTIYSQLVEWARGLKPIVTKEAVSSGQYARQYPVESGNASKFRKAIESGSGDCPGCPQRLPQFLEKHKITAASEVESGVKQ